MKRPSAAGPSLLVLNCGSRTLKTALFRCDGGAPPHLVLSALVEASARNSDSQISIKDATGASLFDAPIASESSGDSGVQTLLDWLDSNGYTSSLLAAGHRIVHGGPHCVRSQRITPELVAELRNLIPLDPDHAPAALRAIDYVALRFPALPQVACFDTAFHASLPDVARFFDRDIRRYGFHGLAYESVLNQLRVPEPALSRGRFILAHLGSGASIAAVRDGQSIDTSMGLTPLEGLVMSTRSGDVDPGALLYMLGEGGLSHEKLDHLLNKESGLLGVSETSADMRELLQKEAIDTRAAVAVQLFCYRVKKYIGAYAAALGGLDVLAFSGGIGENAPVIRERICAGLDFLGVDIDPSANQANSPLISRTTSRVKICVVRADEESVIAQHVFSVLKSAA